jgi:hypothetical protein
MPSVMKLRPVPGEHRYAVAVEEGSDLWLTLWVKRSPDGEFFVVLDYIRHVTAERPPIPPCDLR